MKVLVVYLGQASRSNFAHSTQIPVCLWFLAKNKNADAKRGFRLASPFGAN